MTMGLMDYVCLVLSLAGLVMGLRLLIAQGVGGRILGHSIPPLVNACVQQGTTISTILA